MIAKLVTHQFRNLESAEISFSPGVTVVAGNNGQGKTNLLEAIHWVTQGWSFRTRRLENAVRFGASEAWLRMEGTAHGGELHRQGLLWRQGKLSVKVGNEEGRGLAALHGHIHAVILGPEDIALVREGPEHRRKWLDVLLCQRYADGVDLLSRFRRVLLQRNRWLKDHRGQTGGIAPGDWAVLEAFTEQFCTLGAKVMSRRALLLDELRAPLAAYYAQLSNAAESIVGTYQGSVKTEGLDEAALAGKLARKLEAMRSVELAHGVTAAGPQKDDLEICFVENRATLREAGSQGQCRTTALAMGLVALEVALGADREPPILLLDDIFAELDVARRQALARVIRDKNCQVLMATPRAEDLPFSADARICVENGVAIPG